MGSALTASFETIVAIVAFAVLIVVWAVISTRRDAEAAGTEGHEKSEGAADDEPTVLGLEEAPSDKMASYPRGLLGLPFALDGYTGIEIQGTIADGEPLLFFVGDAFDSSLYSRDKDRGILVGLLRGTIGSVRDTRYVLVQESVRAVDTLDPVLVRSVIPVVWNGASPPSDGLAAADFMPGKSGRPVGIFFRARRDCQPSADQLVPAAATLEGLEILLFVYADESTSSEDGDIELLYRDGERFSSISGCLVISKGLAPG